MRTKKTSNKRLGLKDETDSPMTRLKRISILIFCLIFAVSLCKATTLGTTQDGRFFTIDGEPTFLFGISYYGALSISNWNFIISDLNDMQEDGINWIRVWVTWQYPVTTGEDVSAVDWQSGTGAAREPYMTRLKQLIAECDRRGMIVDCTFSSDNLKNYPATHIECVKTLATHLQNYRNVYFDVANEFGVLPGPDANRYSRITGLIDEIKIIDPARFCTASGANPLDLGSLDNLLNTGMDFISPHFRGPNDTADKTVGYTKTIIQNMTTLNRRKPIHYQEPHRRDESGFTATQDYYYRDITGAKIAEAAGWCFHNGSKQWDPPLTPYRCFLMNNSRLYTQLDTVELDALNNIKKQIGSASIKVRRYQAEYKEQLSHEKGQREMSFYWGAGSDWCNAGYLTYGPSLTTVTPGTHIVGWDLMINSTEGENDLIATIQVTSNGQVLGTKDIYRYDFYGGYSIKTFFMQFTTTGSSNLQFTTLWYDTSDLFVDNITLYILTGPLTDAAWRFQLVSNGWIGGANEQGCTVTAIGVSPDATDAFDGEPPDIFAVQSWWNEEYPWSCTDLQDPHRPGWICVGDLRKPFTPPTTQTWNIWVAGAYNFSSDYIQLVAGKIAGYPCFPASLGGVPVNYRLTMVNNRGIPGAPANGTSWNLYKNWTIYLPAIKVHGGNGWPYIRDEGYVLKFEVIPQ